MPDWRVPTDLRSLIADDKDATWDCDDWLPITLSVVGGTQHDGRNIDLAWQIEYEPTGCTGYDFCDRVVAAADSADPELVPLLNCGDTESAACVIWVETDNACKRLLAIVWPMVG